MLQRPAVRRVVGLLLTAQGLFGLLLPRRAIRVSNRLRLYNRYQNPGDLRPTSGYVEFTRDLSLATLVFGLLTLWRGLELDDVPAVEGDDDDDGDGDDGPEVIEIDTDGPDGEGPESGDGTGTD